MMIILTGREDYNRDFAFMEQAVAYFRRQGITIAKFESDGEVAMRRINAPVPANLPQRLRQVLKFCLLLLMPRYWPSLSVRHREYVRSVEYKSECLRKVVERLEGKDLIFLTRSAGGRAASLIADETSIHKLICLGYPFRHPQHAEETARYQHLSKLATPCLIVQGERDAYGGREILKKYPLSPQIEVQFVPTDHDFRLADDEMEAVLERILQFIVQ